VPHVPQLGFVRGERCYMCGERNCHESMPQGNHPNWLAFVAMAADPADIAGNEKPAEGGIEAGNFTSILTRISS
jgi:hypothetical protein